MAHMVAPAKEALQCADCHTKDGRMAEIEGVYLPGRDSNRWLDLGGFGILALTAVGVSVHGALRALLNRRNGKSDEEA